jgi:hypothetical protein
MTEIFTKTKCLKLVGEYSMKARSRTDRPAGDFNERGLLAVADALCAVAFAILATTTADPKPPSSGGRPFTSDRNPDARD